MTRREGLLGAVAAAFAALLPKPRVIHVKVEGTLAPEDAERLIKAIEEERFRRAAANAEWAVAE